MRPLPVSEEMMIGAGSRPNTPESLFPLEGVDQMVDVLADKVDDRLH